MTNTPQPKKITARVAFLVLGSAGAGILAVSCAFHQNLQPSKEQAAKFVIYFADQPTANTDHRVRLVNPADFQSKIQGAVWSDLNERDTVADTNGHKILVKTTGLGSPTTAYINIPATTTSSGALSATHVTQKIGINSESQLAQVLAGVFGSGKQESH